MARTRAGTPPQYPSKPHRSGQARLTVRLSNGVRRDLLLGAFGTPQSRERYQRILATLEKNGGLYPVTRDSTPVADLTLAELVLGFWEHAERYYRRVDGSPSRELDNFRETLRTLVRLFGDRVARDFGPKALTEFRQRLIDGTWLTDEEIARRKAKNQPVRLCRKVINQRVNHVRRVYRWAVSEELVSPAAHDALRSVADLRRGYLGTFDYARVQPATEQQISKTLPHLVPQVAAMVQLQRLIGARPTEICLVRGRNIVQRDQPCWWYKIDPNEIERHEEGAGREANLHKTAHHETEGGHASIKMLPLGPQAQAIIRPWLRDDPDEFLFQPVEAVAASRAARRKPGRPPRRRTENDKTAKRAGDRSEPRRHYDRHSYARAVRRAAIKAGVEPWSPHQLKHTCATAVREVYDAEASQVFVGHSRLATTEIYAEKNMKRIAEIALRLG